MLRVLLLSATLLCAQEMRIGAIDFFGYENIDLEAVRKALPVRAGDPFAPSAAQKEQIAAAVKQAIGRDATDITFVCCDATGNGMIYIGLPGASSIQLSWNAAPGGSVRLPDEVVRLYDDMLAASAKAVQAGTAGEDDSQGYALSADPATRDLQLKLREYALSNERIAAEVLKSSSDAKHRAAAATVMGYARQSPAQVAALIHAGFDPDSIVRNDAVRAFGVLLRAKPELARGVDVGRLIDLVRSSKWTDRNKGSFLLLELPGAVDARAVPALMEMAAWQSDGHASPARTLLQRMGALPSFEKQEIATGLGVVYAVTTADVNGDRKLDIVAINNSQLLWFENPTWTRHIVAERITKADNVAIAPRDVDGDGKLDFALGADWQATNTASGGSLHWIANDGRVTNIATEPTLHRIGWADVDGDGRAELIVVPLHGKGTKAPDWTAGPGARILVFRVPADPAKDRWPVEVADDSLHIIHNFITVGAEIWTASAEGVHALKRDSSGKWTKRLVGEGKPGEIKLGRAAGVRRLATVEPWHGNSIVIYDESAPTWKRTVIETGLNQAHALGWADLDKDGSDELVVGWRGKPWGLAYYKLRNGSWMKLPIDDGVAAEDLTVADLNGDGRPEIIAGGRATGNIRIYRTTAARK